MYLQGTVDPGGACVAGKRLRRGVSSYKYVTRLGRDKEEDEVEPLLNNSIYLNSLNSMINGLALSSTFAEPSYTLKKP